jgi:hypothetical protein
VTRSLTGDPITDALVPVAQRLIGAVRDHDTAAVDEALAAAITVTGGRVDPAVALAIVCAAMVPEDIQPSRLLLWVQFQAEYDRLCDAGINPNIARQLTGIQDDKKVAAA